MQRTSMIKVDLTRERMLDISLIGHLKICKSKTLLSGSSVAHITTIQQSEGIFITKGPNDPEFNPLQECMCTLLKRLKLE